MRARCEVQRLIREVFCGTRRSVSGERSGRPDEIEVVR